QTCTVYVNGRSGGDAQRLFALDFSANAVLESPLFSRNVGPLQRGADSRGIAVSPARERAYLAQRNPDALAIVDVSRMPELPSDGCIVPEGVELPPDAGCPDLPPPTGERPAFAPIALSPAPGRPIAAAVIERAPPPPPPPGGGRGAGAGGRGGAGGRPPVRRAISWCWPRPVRSPSSTAPRALSSATSRGSAAAPRRSPCGSAARDSVSTSLPS